jgi:hypothetical protein
MEQETTHLTRKEALHLVAGKKKALKKLATKKTGGQAKLPNGAILAVYRLPGGGARYELQATAEQEKTAFNVVGGREALFDPKA